MLLEDGAAIGLTVVGVVVLVVLVGLGVWCWRRRRRAEGVEFEVFANEATAKDSQQSSTENNIGGQGPIIESNLTNPSVHSSSTDDEPASDSYRRKRKRKRDRLQSEKQNRPEQVSPKEEFEISKGD